MTVRIEGTMTGESTFTQNYNIGRHSCVACDTETPLPPQSVIDELAAKHSTISTVWPGEHWTPTGWTRIVQGGLSSASSSWICDRCTRAVNALLGSRKRGAPPLEAQDLALLEQCVVQAGALAEEALQGSFPPDPAFDAKQGPYSWRAPKTNRVYQSIDQYRAGELREQIRKIRDALRGARVD